MCLIIDKPANTTLDTAFLNDVIDHNPHGWGILWHNKGKLHIRKGMQREGLFNALKQLKKQNVMIHARYTTHGETSLAMAHPFHIVDDIYMMHNGVLHGKDYQCPANKLSDTALFAKTLGEVLSMTVDKNQYLRSKAFHSLVASESLGSSIVFADAQGFVEIGDALDCKTTDGLRVSNTYAFTVNNPDNKWTATYKDDYTYGDDYSPRSWDSYAGPAWWEIDKAIESLDTASYDDVLMLVKSDPSLATEMLLELGLHYKPEHKLNSKAA